MSFSSDYDAGSVNSASTVINATFEGTGTLGVGFVNTSLDTISIQDRTLKVIVVGYNDISDTFSTMTKKSHLNIVDLSEMVENTGLGEGQTQGLDGFAFDGCTNLREITLFPNCTDIEGFAFGNCTSLKKVYQIPSGLTTVDTEAFNGANANVETIFNIALGITERDVASMSATISYSPSSAPAPEITVETYSVTATATLNSDNTYVASKIFSETINSKPVITSSATFSVAENQTSIGTVTATDADGNTSFTYSLSGTDSSELAISSTGELTFVSAPDFETKQTYNATVTVSDGTNIVTQDITVTVTDVNDNTPTITSSPVFTVAENQTSIGTVTATDADENTSFIYSLSGTDSSELAISSTGELTFVSAPDFETKQTYNATVTVSDGTNIVTQDITVTVTDVNDNTPTITSSPVFTVAENQTSIGTVTATDADENTSFTYSVNGDELAISSTGVLTFVTAPDFETKQTYNATVTVSDGTNSTTQDITVTVTDVNDNTPTITSSPEFTVAENQTEIGQVTATDADGNTSFTYSLSGTDSSELAISSTGVLTFVTAPDYETKNTYTATVTVSDGTNSATQNITVTVTDVNDNTPTITSSPVFTVSENQTSIGTVTATDADENTSFTYSVNGDELAISSTGVLTFVTAPDYETKSIYTATVTVTDGTNSATQNITVNVTNVNEAPTIDYEEFILANVFQGTATELETNQLEVVVSDDGDASSFTYQWQIYNDNEEDWTNIDNATSATYVFNKSTDVEKSFRAVVRFTYSDETSGSETLDTIIYYAPPTWNTVPNDKKTATVGENYSYRPSAEGISGSETYYLLESPDWLDFDSKTGDNDNGIPYSNTSPQLVGTPTVAGSYDVKIAVVDDGEIYRASVLTFEITVPFKPATKAALQSAIDKWYGLANNANDTNPLETANNYNGSEYFGNPNTWDTSLITDLSYVFFKKHQTNHPDISKWDVSNVTSMQGTFSNSTFNGELKNWNVASVTDFSYTFANNVVFNQELKRWNVQDAITMKSMFDNAYSFNQTIEPPMMQWKKDSEQYKVSADFPTQLTWDETTINGYLTTIYGSATPQTNPITFRGVFGMIALLKKTYLDNIPDDPTEVGKYNTIKSSFSEVISKLTTNQLEIKKYNSTYNGEEEKWIPTSPTIYFANTDGKTGDDLNDAKDKLNQLRLKSIVDGMLLINKAYDIAKKDLGETGYSTLINEMKSIYDNVYAELPFYVAWYAPLLETKTNFLNNALTMQSGKEGTINQSLTSFIGTNPIKTINDKDYDSTEKQKIVQLSSADLFNKFKAAYTP